MKLFKREPVVTVAAIGRLIEALVILLPLFGFTPTLSAQQQAALATVAVVAGGAIETAIQRSKVSPVASVEDEPSV